MDKLAEIEKLLNIDRFESKNWKQGDVVERVHWLLIMVENYKEESNMWLNMLLEKQKTNG